MGEGDLAIDCAGYGWSLNHLIEKGFIRPATGTEIKMAIKNNVIMVGKYCVSFNEEAITVGCQEVNKAKFLEIGKKAGWI